MSDGQVDIKGLNKAKVLAALYNGSRAQGLGMLHLKDSPMTVEEAEQIIANKGLDYDYLQGRVMKVRLQGDSFDPSGYDRDNGQGKAQAIINELRRSDDVASEVIEASHLQGTHEAALLIQNELGNAPKAEDRGDLLLVTLGIEEESATMLAPILLRILGEDASDHLKEEYEKRKPSGEVTTPEVTADGLKSVANETMMDLLRRNYELGSRSNAILAQEAAGQKSFVESDTLPTDMPREAKQALEKAGVQFLGQNDKDPVFQFVILPEGWQKRPTNHSMWSDLVDDHGRNRAGIFFKAASYDRSAHLHVNRRYSYSIDYDKLDEGSAVAYVEDCGEVIHTTKAVKIKNDDKQAARDEALAEAKAWLEQYYPKWEDASEYWDDAPKAKSQPDATDVTPGMWYLVKQTPQSAAAKSLAGKEVGVIAVDTRTGTCSVHTADIFTNHSGVAVTLPLSDLTDRPAGKPISM